MRDKGWILSGLVAFLGLITYPIWYNLAAGELSQAPELRLPATEKNCVAPLEYMRTSHMDLLMAWRDEVVRNNDRSFVAFDGRTHEMSLTGSCIGCHENKKEFCDRCHDYAGVNPYCWDCHVDPAMVPRSE